MLVWSYNASVSTLTGATPSRDRIHHHAQTLIAQLYADRKLERQDEKPIIFLCHSLGGLVVKRALSYSSLRSLDKITHIQSIFTCTYGILFFGTPHQGSSKAKLLGTLQKLASTIVPKQISQFKSSLVSALEEESETLQNITDYFIPLIKHFRLCFFWEQEKTDLKYTKEYIVERESAAPNFDNTERSGISADHSGMVKFDSNRSPGFRMAAAVVLQYCEDAPKAIRNKLAASRKQLSEERQREA